MHGSRGGRSPKPETEGMRDHESFSDLRSTEFPGLGTRVYLNAASLGPLPERTRQVLCDQADLRTRVHEMSGEDFVRPAQAAREAVARLLGASPEEIALGGNTSYGINLVAMGLDVPAGSVVLVSAGEFPANVYPWMGSQRLQLELVPLTEEGFPDEERLLAALRRPEVRVLALSSVQFSSGYRADLERIGRACREAEVLFVVDAIQSLGALPLDVSTIPVDVVASGGHKWLCAPFGVGFCYVRREVQERIEPPTIGWTAMRRSADLASVVDYEWGLVEDARRYEVATPPLQDLLALAASIELLLEVGVDRTEAYLDDLLDPVRQWVREHPSVHARSPLEGPHRSAILSFTTPDTGATFQRLEDAGVVASLREGAIRIAPHFYNTPADIARVLEVLEADSSIAP